MGVEDRFYYTIGDGCVKCGRCAGQCPTGAISEGALTYAIEAAKCIDCVRAMTAGGKTPHYLPETLFGIDTPAMNDTLDEYHTSLNRYIEAH